MVKLGFIVEGDTEKILLDSPAFKDFLRYLNVDHIPDIANAEGSSKLLPHNILQYTRSLLAKGAQRIFVLTDLDAKKCVTQTIQRVSPLPDQTVIVSIKQIEAWFLADTNALRKFLKRSDYYCEFPETIPDPYEEIKKIRQQYWNRGVDKKVLAKQMIKSGFSVENAAKHSNCNSAKYFLKKLSEFSQNK